VFSLYCPVIFISVIFKPKIKSVLDMGIPPTLPTALWLYYT